MSTTIPSLTDLHARGAAQQPTYPDAAALASVVGELRERPPLVFAGEADDLKERIADVAAGRAFMLQAGDCAETFGNVTAVNIRNALRVQLSMAVVLQYAAQVPVVKVGRIAGQYAKPRSSNDETRDGLTLPSYRGDAVNGLDFNAESRVPDPRRLLDVYNSSAATLNLVRAFVNGGFADLRTVHSWNTDFVRNSRVEAKYEALSDEIERAMAFMIACGVSDDAFRTVNYWASHEALLMEYEHALTRIDSRTGTPYGTSGHLLWIGERTRQIDGAHVELLSRLRNPVGVKLGPTTTPEVARELVERLDPDNEPGRLTIITRMGAGKVRDALPAIIEAVEATGRKVAWVCDPMHGNTYSTEKGFKTRAFPVIWDEVDGFFDVHAELGTWPGGVHIELTGNDVTECVGGVDELDEDALADRYETACDPRLNRNQGIELAFYLAERLRNDILRRGTNPIQEFTPREM
ncbi:3-deoxy-7-phosphoheptulonate synthase class II [Propioniciclava sinopodophylli]|uniref:Phospho-2-dehydro-3-deoxyheptonate aldolase n=1 Tax=Propioniciclava sinopodophylli TaxID=1837344 RepID=A0A4Q9KFW1_9ACTN|nr:3-deoxy-7-phosphoheptulonate synthase class II [Propioniciclava sinopodophylli]TBT87309.1 3-deoxy-7-phosphoheptulonate synthase class II [Propioniciclava sinopodophylli]